MLSAKLPNLMSRISNTIAPTSATMKNGSIATIHSWRRMGLRENTITKVAR